MTRRHPPFPFAPASRSLCATPPRALIRIALAPAACTRTSLHDLVHFANKRIQQSKLFNEYTRSWLRQTLERPITAARARVSSLWSLGRCGSSRGHNKRHRERSVNAGPAASVGRVRECRSSPKRQTLSSCCTANIHSLDLSSRVTVFLLPVCSSFAARLD